MNYQSLVKQSHKDSVRLSEICNLANLGHYSLDEKDSEVQSFFVDLDSLNVRATELAVLYDYVESSFCVKSVEVDDSDLILYND